MNQNLQDEPTSADQPSGLDGQIGQDIKDRVKELETRYEYLATREWVWKGAFLALVGGISIGITLTGVIIKMFSNG